MANERGFGVCSKSNEGDPFSRNFNERSTSVKVGMLLLNNLFHPMVPARCVGNLDNFQTYIDDRIESIKTTSIDILNISYEISLGC